MGILRLSPICVAIFFGLAACNSEKPREQLYGADTGMPSGGIDSGDGGEDADDVRTERWRPGDPPRMRDDGRPGDPDPCPNGSEGCECTSTSTTVFLQEICEEGLLCVPWDQLSGLNSSQLEGRVKTCVKPCSRDSDCGRDRFCRSFG